MEFYQILDSDYLLSGCENPLWPALCFVDIVMEATAEMTLKYLDTRHEIRAEMSRMVVV